MKSTFELLKKTFSQFSRESNSDFIGHLVLSDQLVLNIKVLSSTIYAFGQNRQSGTVLKPNVLRSFIYLIGFAAIASNERSHNNA